MTKHLRVSNVTAEQIAEAQSIAPVECVQNFYNLAKSTQLIVSTASIESRRKKGFRKGRGSNRALRPYVPFFPLGGFTPLQSETLSNVAARLNARPMSVALAWLLQRSQNILLIPGTSSTGTPEREWRANGMSDMAGKAAVEPSGSERDTMLLALASNCPRGN